MDSTTQPMKLTKKVVVVIFHAVPGHDTNIFNFMIKY